MSALHCTQCGERQASEARFCPRCGTANVVGSSDGLVGTVIADRYLLTDKIGQGSAGTIYRAEHTTLHRKIAVKILHHQLSRDEAAVERFRREATTIGQIDNDHLLQVIDFGRTPDKRLFFAMELLEGETLEDAVRREQRLEPARAAKILLQIADAVAEAHQHGYIHRDLRPRNVFLALRRGEKDFVKLLDFGLAKLVLPEVDTHQTALGMTFGDPRYMSPEQARGDKIDPRSDIFSLGVVAHQILTGSPPFEGNGPFDVLAKVLDSPTPRVSAKRPDVPAWLDALVTRCLQKDAKERFEDMGKVAECLRKQSAPHVPSPTLMGMPVATQLPATPAPAAPSSAPAQAEPVVERPAPAQAPVKAAAAPTPSRTLIMPTALPASIAAAQAQVAAPPEAPSVESEQPQDRTAEETNPGRKPPVRELLASMAPAEMVSGEMRSPTQVTPVVMDPAADSIVVEEGMGALRDEPTGPHRTGGDDGWFSDRQVPPPTDEEFEEEAPRRGRNPLVIGAIVGGASLTLFLTVLLWPRAPKPAPAPPIVAAPPPPAPAPAQPTPALAPAAQTPVAAKPAPAPPAPPEAAKPAPTTPEPAKPEVARVEPKPEVATPEPAKPEPKPEVARPKVATPEPAKPKPAKPEPAKPEPAIASTAAKPKPASTPKGFKDPFGANASGGEVDALVKTGRQKLGAGDLAQAQSAFAKARELDGKNADALAGLGEVAFEHGDYAGAAAQLKQALRISPNRARFLILLGQAYYKQGRAKEAAAEYKRALKVDPTNQEAQRSLELAEKKLASGG